MHTGHRRAGERVLRKHADVDRRSEPRFPRNNATKREESLDRGAKGAGSGDLARSAILRSVRCESISNARPHQHVPALLPVTLVREARPRDVHGYRVVSALKTD